MRRLFVPLLLLAACATAPGAASGPASFTVAVSLGDVPARRAQVQALGRSLEASLRGPVAVDVAPDYRSFSRGLAERRWDLVLAGPVLFSRAQEAGYRAVAVAERDGLTERRGVLLARRDRPIRSPADLAGKAVAFVDACSASGFQYPFAFLWASGLKPADYARSFVGSHDAVLRAVLDGRADAGATYDGATADLLPPDQAARLVVVGQTDPIPGEVFAVRAGSERIDIVSRALLSLHRLPDAAQVLGPLKAGRLVPPREGLFEGARAIDLLVSESAGL